jgi:hypothetical protein
VPLGELAERRRCHTDPPVRLQVHLGVHHRRRRIAAATSENPPAAARRRWRIVQTVTANAPETIIARTPVA